MAVDVGTPVTNIWPVNEYLPFAEIVPPNTFVPLPFVPVLKKFAVTSSGAASETTSAITLSFVPA